MHLLYYYNLVHFFVDLNLLLAFRSQYHRQITLRFIHLLYEF